MPTRTTVPSPRTARRGSTAATHRDEYRRDDDRDDATATATTATVTVATDDRPRDRDRDRSDRDSDDRGSDRDRDRDRDRSDRDKPGLTRTAQVDATPPAKAGDDLSAVLRARLEGSRDRLARRRRPKIVHAGAAVLV